MSCPVSDAPDRVDVAVVGAGPAGLSAAAAAAGAGASVLVVDEGPGPGGLLRWQTHALGDRDDMFCGMKGVEVAARMERAALDAGARALYGAAVWDIDGELSVSYLLEGRAGRVRARRIIVATGSTEGVVPFPGWTLEGVVGLRDVMDDAFGAIGRHALVVGDGDAAMLAARCVSLHGARSVIAISSAGAPTGSTTEMLRATLAGARVLVGASPVRASGDGRVEEVSISGPFGTADIAAGLVVLATHRVPEFRAASLLGARASYSADLGGWVPRLDAGMRASDPRVLVAGDAAGIGGAARAAHQGTIAGLSASSDLGLEHPDGGVLAAAARAGSDARSYEGRTPGGQRSPAERAPALAGLGGDVVACRCTGATVGEIDAVIAGAGAAADEIRRLSRAGMGECQGRMCDDLVAEVAAARAGVSPGEIGRPRTRPPLRAVPLPALAAMEGGG